MKTLRGANKSLEMGAKMRQPARVDNQSGRVWQQKQESGDPRPAIPGATPAAASSSRRPKSIHEARREKRPRGSQKHGRAQKRRTSIDAKKKTSSNPHQRKGWDREVAITKTSVS